MSPQAELKPTITPFIDPYLNCATMASRAYIQNIMHLQHYHPMWRLKNLPNNPTKSGTYPNLAIRRVN